MIIIEPSKKKITKATVKSFIRKHSNENNLYVKQKSSFGGMTDCVESVNDNFRKVESIDFNKLNTFGIDGLWLVNGSRDSFYNYQTDQFAGFEIYNSCGSSLIVTKI